MKRVLWFSRHEMSEEQLNDLVRIYGLVELTQINKTIKSAYELSDEIASHDVIAIVAPLPIQQQFLKLADDKPVIFCKNDRIVSEDGEKVTFSHAGWFQIQKIEVIFDLL